MESIVCLQSLVGRSGLLPCHDVCVQLGGVAGSKEMAVISLASDQSGTSSVSALWLKSRDTLMEAKGRQSPAPVLTVKPQIWICDLQ